MAIRSPLHHATLSCKHLIICIVTIFGLSFCLTFYYNLWYIKLPASQCGDPSAAERLQNFLYVPVVEERVVISEKLRRQLNITETSSLRINYVKVSMIIGVVVVVIGPLILLTFLNSGLIYYVKQSHKAVKLAESQEQERHAKERKITIVVCVIVGSFLILNCPSAILHLWNMVETVPTWHSSAAQVSNSLVIMNKVINFILYCLSSQNFRRKAWAILRCSRQKRQERPAEKKREGKCPEKIPLTSPS